MLLTDDTILILVFFPCTHQVAGNVAVEVNADAVGQNATLAEATINADGQLVLTGDASAFAGKNKCLNVFMVYKLKFLFKICRLVRAY